MQNFFNRKEYEVPLNFPANITYVLSSFTEQVLYEHLSLIEVESFASIPSQEFVNWKGKNKEEICPNLAASVNRFNSVSFWVVNQITSADDKTGALIIENVIKTMRVTMLPLFF